MHGYLMSHPELVPEMTDRRRRRTTQADKAKAAAHEEDRPWPPSSIPRIAFVTGPADAKKTLVEFYDYDCPYCRASLPAVKKFYEQHKNDTRFSFIEFPIKGPAWLSAVLAAQASLAARRQPDKYMEFHFALMGENEPVDRRDDLCRRRRRRAWTWPS